MNNRLKLLAALGASTLAAPLHSLSKQKGKIRRVGFLGQREVVDVDADVYYGPFRPDMRELGYIVAAAKPGTSAAQKATTAIPIFDVFIDRKTAKALGLTIPQSLLVSAEKVIE